MDFDDGIDDAALMAHMDSIDAGVGVGGGAVPTCTGGAPHPPQGPVAALSQIFGFEQFREGQEGVVVAALEGRDTAVFWATGRGKSICYQLPALITGRTAIVVSPLISLMTDQVTKLPYPTLPHPYPTLSHPTPPHPTLPHPTR